MTTLEFTSDVVRNIKFREKMRGYHPDEVHAFVERAATTLDQLQAQLAEVTERATKAEAMLASNAENDGMLRRTLTLAEKTAELAIGEADDEAERIRSTARAEAERLKTETDDECRQRIAEAEETRQAGRAEAATLVKQAESQAAELHQAAEETIAARAEAAQGELDAALTSLVAQRTMLQDQVDALAAYLADERARVLAALNAAVKAFGTTLVPAERPASVSSAMQAEAPEPPTTVRVDSSQHITAAPMPTDELSWESAGPATTTWSDAEPSADLVVRDEDEPVAGSPFGAHGDGEVSAGRAESDESAETDRSVESHESEAAEPTEAAEEMRPPSTLLFTFDGDRRHLDGERRRASLDRSESLAMDAKPRRPARGRRPS
jgi:DivIVA domain-containing protein